MCVAGSGSSYFFVIDLQFNSIMVWEQVIVISVLLDLLRCILWFRTWSVCMNWRFPSELEKNVCPAVDKAVYGC